MEKAERKENLVNWKALRESMDRAGVDAVVATAPENTFYLSGCSIRTQVSIRDRLALVVYPRNGEPSYIVCNIEESLARSVSWIDDVRIYVEFAKSPIKALAEVLEEKGLSNGKLAVEEKFLTAAYYRELKSTVPNATLVAAEPILSRARAIKTPAEIALLERAFLLTEEGVHAAWKRSHPGDREKDVAERMAEEMLQRGADGVRHITFASGENTLYVHGRPGPKVLEVGDLVTTDFGANFGGFCSDFARMGIVGKASPEQRDNYKSLRDVYMRTIGLMKPGVPVRDLYNFCKEQLVSRGYQPAFPHIGHSCSQGGGHEDPMVQPAEETALETNMLICIEPSVRMGNERYHIEDLILVTENGHKLLSNWWNTEELFVFE